MITLIVLFFKSELFSICCLPILGCILGFRIAEKVNEEFYNQILKNNRLYIDFLIEELRRNKLKIPPTSIIEEKK